MGLLSALEASTLEGGRLWRRNIAVVDYSGRWHSTLVSLSIVHNISSRRDILGSAFASCGAAAASSWGLWARTTAECATTKARERGGGIIFPSLYGKGEVFIHNTKHCFVAASNKLLLISLAAVNARSYRGGVRWGETFFLLSSSSTRRRSCELRQQRLRFCYGRRCLWL